MVAPHGEIGVVNAMKHNDMKKKMRQKVKTLFNYWHNITLPINYNVVSLPGESFDFEGHVADRAGTKNPNENLLLWMYENDSKIYNKFKDHYEDNLGSRASMFLYLRENVPPISWFKALPTFAWYDFCGNPTKQRFNCIYNKDVNKNTVAVVTYNTRTRLHKHLHPMVMPELGENYVEQASREVLTNRLPYVLFSHNYKQKRYGIPMVMTALTNSKQLANVYNKNAKRFSSVEDNNLFIKKAEKARVKKHIDNPIKYNIENIYMDILMGSKDKDLMEQHSITKNQLSGYKRTVTHKRKVGKLKEFVMGLSK